LSESPSAFGPPQEGRVERAADSVPVIDLEQEDEEMAVESPSGIEPQRRGWVASLASVLSLRRSKTEAAPPTREGSERGHMSDKVAGEGPQAPPSCWKCTVEFSFTNRPRVCPMCGHQFCKACLAEAAAEVPLTPADLQDSVMRANRLSIDAEWTTLEDVQRLQQQQEDGSEARETADDDDRQAELGRDTVDPGTREEVRKGLHKLDGTL
ncbi:hypothetical protein FOZ63_017765, partial [Perkinsus olseni]